MTKTKFALAGMTLLGVATWGALAADGDDAALLARAQGLFQALPENAATSARPVTPALAALGQALFFETRVSGDGKVSCGGCHNPQFYGAEPIAQTVGFQGKVLPRNTPTVFNTALQFVQHYGGNRVDVEEQAVKALVSPFAYANKDLAAAEAKMRALPGYRAMFEKAFPGQTEPVTAENWGKAIGAYERTLLTPSAFDRFLRGDIAALNTQQQRGLDQFINTGCVGCHSGVTVGGQMYQKFGITAEYWSLTGSKENELLKGRDKGRFHDTKKEEDAFIFKVQQLRNVAMTPPYFHDGSVATLPEAVKIMAKLQLGKDLSDAEVSDIVAFLGALTGDVPQQFAQMPNLPAAAYRVPQ